MFIKLSGDTLLDPSCTVDKPRRLKGLFVVERTHARPFRVSSAPTFEIYFTIAVSHLWWLTLGPHDRLDWHEPMRGH